MAIIGLLPVDGKINYPNLATMKIAAYHKAQGDLVEMYNPLFRYDRVYVSKIFSYTPGYSYVINADEIIYGGSGYDVNKVLPTCIDRLQPDYSIYPYIDKKTAYGFLTRGCPNKCKWCIVPIKEGGVTPYMDIEEIAIEGRNHVILMDNNILASDYGLEQLKKIIDLKLYVDFNQALDARLVTPEIADLLARVRWIKRRIRFGCDTPQQIQHCERAIALIDGAGYTGDYFFYCILIGDFTECYNRVNHWRKRGRRYLPFCQPYRDVSIKGGGQVIPQWQKDLARWADKKWIFKTCTFAEFSPRKGFLCAEYFNHPTIK